MKVAECWLNARGVRLESALNVRCDGAMRRYSVDSVRGHFHLIGMREHLLVQLSRPEQTRLHSGDIVICQDSVSHALVAATLQENNLPESSASSIVYGEFEVCAGSTGIGRLPPYLVVRAHDASDYLRQLTHLLLSAAQEKRFGQQLLLNQLAGSLLAFVLCEHSFQTAAHGEPMLLIQDVRIGRALQAIDRQLGERWTVHSLAAIAGMSRSTFALHFTTMVGVSPMLYVALRRVEKARHLLRDDRLSVARVADMLGYGSEAAFRKLFKRIEGVGPGNVRAAARLKNRAPLETGRHGSMSL